MIIEAIAAVKRLTPQEKVILAGELCRDALDNEPTASDADIRRWLTGQWKAYLRETGRPRTWAKVKQRLRARHA